MELDYYLSLSQIPSSLVQAQIEFSYLFSGVTVDDPIDELDGPYYNYTLIFTLERTLYHSQLIYSNYSAAGSGYAIGINSSNELFIDYPLRSFSYTFKVRLGNRNCIAIKKAENTFTVFVYDLISGVIKESDSIYVEENDRTLLTNSSTLYFGGNALYEALPQNNSSVKKLYGFFDQLLFISEAIDDSALKIILKGFRPETLTPSVSSSYNFQENYSWESPQLEQYKTYFSTFYNERDKFLHTGSFRNGYSTASETGYFGSGGFTLNISCYTGYSGTCSGGGLTSTGYYNTGMPDSVPKYTYSGYTEIFKNTSNTFTSRRVSLFLSGSEYKFGYNTAYATTSTSTGYASSFDSGYYSGFMFDGTYAELELGLAYGAKTGIAPTGYHRAGVYDFIKNGFKISEYSAPTSFYLNKQPEIGGTVTSGYFYPPVAYSTSSSDILIYDNVIDYTPMDVFGNNTWAKGRFWPGTSRVLDSVYFDNLIIDKEYVETSTGHIYHLQNHTTSGTSFLMNI